MTSHPSGQPEPPLDCAACERLVAYRKANAAAHPEWHNAPVMSFGSDEARLLIVGLAPGLQGANKTGRPFTGDFAGDLLYGTLAKFGFSRGTYAASPDDGLTLRGAMITNAVRCVPPENKPVGAEINACRGYLIARLAALPRMEVAIALGKIAHDSVVRACGAKLSAYGFAHGAEHRLVGPAGPFTLIDSYHCSRYNTNTGRLTPEMFEAVFAAAKKALG